MTTRPLLQPDRFPLAGGPRMAYDARPRPGGRDAEPGGSPALEAAAQAADPASALMAYFREAMGEDHEDQGGFARLVEDCANWTGEARGASDASIARRLRNAALARDAAAEQSINEMFPDAARIRLA
jgi:hypothetical protein